MQNICLEKRILFFYQILILGLKESDDIIDLVNNSLNETGFTFFFKREKSELMLSTKGALIVSDDNVIVDYEDKPQENVGRFNAFWTSFAFRKESLIVVWSLWRSLLLTINLWLMKSNILQYIILKQLR